MIPVTIYTFAFVRCSLCAPGEDLLPTTFEIRYVPVKIRQVKMASHRNCRCFGYYCMPSLALYKEKIRKNLQFKNAQWIALVGPGVDYHNGHLLVDWPFPSRSRVRFVVVPVSIPCSCLYESYTVE